MFKLYVFLPQISSRSLRLGANRRREVIEELKESSTVVLQLLVGNAWLIDRPRLTFSKLIYPKNLDWSCEK